MDEDRKQNEKKRIHKLLLGIGAIVLIILLLVWLFIASAAGDTDVAAFIVP